MLKKKKNKKLDIVWSWILQYAIELDQNPEQSPAHNPMMK
jgi:hypothetical protein